jgi:cell division protein FtsB
VARNSQHDTDRAPSSGFPRQSDPAGAAPSRGSSQPASHAAAGHHAEILDFERISATRGANEAAQNASFSSLVSSRTRQTGATRHRHQAEHAEDASVEGERRQTGRAAGAERPSIAAAVSGFFQRFGSAADNAEGASKAHRASVDVKQTAAAEGAKAKAAKGARSRDAQSDKDDKKHRFHVSFDWIRSSRPAQISAIVCACLILGCAFVYPSAKDAYTAVRNADQAQAEYQAVVDRNNEIQSRIDTLKTDEGIEDLARNSYGYVMEGEKSVRVAGLGSQSIAADAENQTPAVASGSVAPPTTWYSPVLDVVFGYTPDNATTTADSSSSDSGNSNQ